MSERKGTCSWVQFGDLHLTRPDEENYQDFLDLVQEANTHLAGQVDFAFLPGDNADDGTPEQYRLVRSALTQLKLPYHVITGDHDRKGETLDYFRHALEPRLHRSHVLRNFHLLFLNAMDGPDGKTFDFGGQQMEYVRSELATAKAQGRRPMVFTHLYPSELVGQGRALSELLRYSGVELVAMGHTHYNEIANDGSILYTTTRSTGQIEEGPPGFSITVIDDDVISWKFKERRVWPFAMITSPADHRLITHPNSVHQVVRGSVPIRARVWNAAGVDEVECSVNDGSSTPMQRGQDGFWTATWDSTRHPDGLTEIRVRATSPQGPAEDAITVLVNQDGHYTPPQRNPVDYENTVGAWPEKGILGTQLGPNENGTKGSWPSWR